MLVFVLAFGIAVVGCDNDPSNENENGTGNGKKLTINGIGFSGNVIVILSNGGGPTDEIVAYGTASGVTNGGNVTFDLKKIDISNTQNPLTNDGWNGNGSFHIMVYNKTLQQLIEQQPAPDKILSPTSFSGETTTVSWQ